MDNITSTTTTHTYTNQGVIGTYETKTFSLPMTLNGQTRQVLFSGSTDIGGACTSDAIFACQIGAGAKRHRGNCLAWSFETLEDAKRKGYSSDRLFLVDNVITGIQGLASVRNRAARITGWADEVAGTAQATQQKYYGGF